jgi:purine nucleosidase/pyrimidine-specific ribonucleoside hydrolase
MLVFYSNDLFLYKEIPMSRRRLSPIILAQVLLLLITGCGSPETPDELISPDTPVSPTSTSKSPPPSTIAPTDEPTPSVELASSVSEFHLIYDDDGSRDGTVALLYLLSEPNVNMMAVNISYGEAHPDTYIQYIGRMLDAAGHADIPLGAGQDGPVGNGTPFPDWLRQLSDDFWNYQLPNAGKTYPFQFAPELMVDTINQSAEPVTIFMSGTFTSLAQALRIDPGIQEKIDAVYIMGGAVYVPGNITNLIPDSGNKVSEWNLISDPVAAAEVFDSGLEMYLVPLDSTNKVIFHKEDIQPWHDGDQKAKFSAELYDIMFNEYGWTEAEIFDLGAAVIMVEPDACEFVPLHLDVITEDGENLGQTVVNPDTEPNINVCLDPDADLIMQVLNDVFSGAPESSDIPEVPLIDPLVGSWSGIAVNNGFEMDISITINETCLLGNQCGQFGIKTIACSGSLSWVGMDGDMYQFQASELTDTCGEGSDYLLPLADGSVEYLWKGDSGETTGILQREP